MTLTRPAPAPRVQSAVPAPAPSGLRSAWNRFWFTPSDPTGLHVLRKLTGLLLLAWLLPFAGQVDTLFGLGGWFDAAAYREAARLPVGPPHPIGWSVLFLAGTNPLALRLIYVMCLGVVALFTLGFWPRLTSVLTYVVAASFTASPAVAYDAEDLLLLFAFYLMIGYVFLGQSSPGLSWRERLLGPNWIRPGHDSYPGRPSVAANVALRLWQVHFAIAVVAGALHKLQFGDWWSGVAFWYALNPAFGSTAESVRAWAPYGIFYLTVLSVAAYAALAWQIGFPLFAWKPRWRPVLVGGAVLGWLGVALIYGLPLFGPALLIGVLAYVTPSEWSRLADRIGAIRVPALRSAFRALVN